MTRLVGSPGSTRLKVVKSIGWRGSAQVICLAIKLCSSLILARFLRPADYGVFGTAITIVVTLELLSDLGIWPALVRHPQGGQLSFLRTGWWIGVMRGTALTALVAALAWPLAAFYRQPALLPVLLVLSLRSLLVSLRSPGMFLALRNLDYRPIFVEEVVGAVVMTAVSLTTAWFTRSAWAFVAGTMAGSVASVAVTFLLRPVAVAWTWDRAAEREIAHLGRQIFVNTLLMALWMNLDRLFGAKLLKPAPLGIYFFALSLAVNAEVFITRTYAVFFATLARYPDPEAKAARSRQVLDRLARWAMPLMAAVVVASPVVIHLLFGRRWAAAQFPFAVMIARLMFVAMGRMQFQYLLSVGNIGVNTSAYAVAAAMQAILIVPLARAWGPTGLAFAGFGAAVVYAGVQTVLLSLRGDGRLRPLLITAGWAVVGLAVAYHVAA